MEAAPRSHTAIQVDRAVLNGLARRYRVHAGTILELKTSGDRLAFTWVARGHRLLPETEHVFFAAAANVTWAFVRNAKGSMVEAVRGGGNYLPRGE